MKIFQARNLPRGITTCLLGALSYKLGSKPSRGPIVVSWDFSSECNFNCRYCHFPHINKEGALTKSQKETIVRTLGEAGVWFIGFGGGESLISPDLECCVLLAKNCGINVSISTNGYILEDMVDQLLAWKVDQIIISVDHFQASIHDTTRNKSGSFSNIQKGIARLQKLKKGTFPLLYVRTVVTKANVDTLYEHVKYWRKIADHVVLHPMENNDAFFHVDPELLLDKKQVGDLSNQLKCIMEEFPEFRNPYYKNFSNSFLSLRVPPEDFCCYSGIFLADIDIRGNVFPCGTKRFLLGNLLENSMLDIWRSDKAQKWKSYCKHERQCQCWSGSYLASMMMHQFLK